MAKKIEEQKTAELTEAELKQAENKKSEPTRIEIKTFPVKKARIKIVGDSPLLVHAWSEKSKRELLEKQQNSDSSNGKRGKTKQRAPREPFADFVNAAYWISPKPKVDGLPDEEQHRLFEEAWENGATFGFPVIAFKKAAVTAVWSANLITSQPFMKRLFHVRAVEGAHIGSGLELTVIHTDEPPELCEDAVKIGPTKTSDLRYRPAFRNWWTELEIELIETGTFKMEDIISAFSLAGFMNGVGEWRIERDGEFGCFHVESVEM